MEAVRVDSCTGVKLSIRDVDASESCVNNRGCRDTNEVGGATTMNLGTRYGRSEAPLPQLPRTISVEGVYAIILSRHIHNVVGGTFHFQTGHKQWLAINGAVDR